MNNFAEIPKGRNWVKIWCAAATAGRVLQTPFPSLTRAETRCAACVTGTTQRSVHAGIMRHLPHAPTSLTSRDRSLTKPAHWTRPQILPLYAVIGLATFNMSNFMYKYFTGNTEVNWDKTLRKTYDNQGINPDRVEIHNRRFGLMGPEGVNKSQVRAFPFNFIPMDSIINKRYNPKLDRAEVSDE